MEKQYSVEFFACFIDSVQKLCRDYLNFEQAVELSGYLCLEIDNSKKERYVLSELVQSSGDVISESYCTKAFKTVRKGPAVSAGYRGVENISPRDRSFRGQKEPPPSTIHQRGQTDSFVSRQSFLNAGDRQYASSNSTLFDTNLGSSRSHNVQHSEAKSLKRTGSIADATTPHKRDKLNTSNASVENEVSATQDSVEKESIRMPLTVSIKQENDVPYMVIDNPEDDLPEDQFENTERNAGNDSLTSSRGNSHGDSRECTERSALMSRQMQERERHTDKNTDNSRNETFSSIQRMFKAQQENLIRIQTAPSMSLMRTLSPLSQTFSCDKCGYVSKWKSNLTRHMRLKHGEMKDDQNIGYPYYQVLNNQNVYSSCSLTPSSPPSPPQQVNPNTVNRMKSSVKAAEGKQVQSEQSESQKRRQEDETLPRYRCQEPNCGQTFWKTEHLQEHMNGHYKIKPYKCENCGEAFESHFDWKKHYSGCEPNLSSSASDVTSDSEKNETGRKNEENVSSN